MKRFRYGLFALVAAALHAGQVDVSSAQTVTVGHGGSLTFDLFTSSYTANAQALGVPLYPTDLTFSFVTAASTSGEFLATLSSPDASINLALGPLDFTAGYLSSAGFQGTVSTLQGQFHLDSALSQQLFSSGSVLLTLQNTGGSLLLGLPSFTLEQDLFASLSGGPLSVGARPGGVTLDNPLEFSVSALGFQLPAQVPEPGSGLLLAGGGVLFWAISGRLKRRLRRPD
jgi:PEP-CTERM motif